MTRSYNRALLFSGIFHGLLVLVLLADFSTNEPFKLSGSPMATPPSKPVDIVQAVAMDQTKVAEAVKQLEAKRSADKAREVARQRELERQAKAAENKRIQETQRMKQMQQKANAELKKLHEEKIKEAKRIEQAKEEHAKLEKQQEKLEKKRELEAKRVKELKKLREEQVRLAKERADQVKQKAEETKRKQEAEAKLAEETKRKQEAEAKRREAQLAAAKAEKLEMMQGELNRYKNLILQTLSQNWITPESVDKNLKVEYQIVLGPGGAIKEVTLIKSSGNEQLDRSARVAIYKSSPLPVPSDVDLFNLFRVVHLTVRPEGFVTSG